MLVGLERIALSALVLTTVLQRVCVTMPLATVSLDSPELIAPSAPAQMSAPGMESVLIGLACATVGSWALTAH